MKRILIGFLVVCLIIIGLHINAAIYFKVKFSPVINSKITAEESLQIADSIDIVLDENMYVSKTYADGDEHYYYYVLITGFENPVDFVLDNLKFTEVSGEDLNALKSGLESVKQKNRFYEIDGYEGYTVKSGDKSVELHNIDGKYYAEIEVSNSNEVVSAINQKGKQYITWKYY